MTGEGARESKKVSKEKMLGETYWLACDKLSYNLELGLYLCLIKSKYMNLIWQGVYFFADTLVKATADCHVRSSLKVWMSLFEGKRDKSEGCI